MLNASILEDTPNYLKNQLHHVQKLQLIYKAT